MCVFCFGVGCFNALPGKLPVGFRYYFCFVYCSGKNVAPSVLRSGLEVFLVVKLVSHLHLFVSQNWVCVILCFV